MQNNSDIKVHNSFGVIAIHNSTNPKFMLIKHNGRDHWAFPKGTPEGFETPLETAKRELREETGISNIDIKIEQVFGEKYDFVNKEGNRVHKINTYYLGFVDEPKETKTEVPEEILDLGWFDYESAMKQLTHQEARDLLVEVKEYLNKPHI